VETLLDAQFNNVTDNIKNKHITMKEESVDISPIVETFIRDEYKASLRVITLSEGEKDEKIVNFNIRDYYK
jgi:hypothetical protein